MNFSDLSTGIAQGRIVPILGPGALQGARHPQTGEPIPADSNSLILAMNNGKPMAPKLMYEFPRAAMNQELKRGRKFIQQFLTRLYQETAWSVPPLYHWLAGLNLPYVIDLNRDSLLQQLYASRPHTLIFGVARLGGTEYRFKLFDHDGQSYREIQLEQADTKKPVLFKPLGSPIPEAHYIASDADYVDYLTELMGGFAIPAFIKEYRQGKQYALLGLPLGRDTERMMLTELIFAAGTPAAYALMPQATDKEKRFCKRQGIEILAAGIDEWLAAAMPQKVAA